MYFSFQDLMTFGLFIIGLLTLIFSVVFALIKRK